MGLSHVFSPDGPKTRAVEDDSPDLAPRVGTVGRMYISRTGEGRGASDSRSWAGEGHDSSIMGNTKLINLRYKMVPKFTHF